MYDEEDFRQLEAQINYRIGLQREQAKYDASQWVADGLGFKEDESLKNA